MTTPIAAPSGMGENDAEVALSGAAARDQMTLELLRQAAATGDETERSALHEEAFLLNTPMAEMFARRYRGRGIEWEDLLQVAFVGLIKAIQGFRVDEGVTFVAFAAPTVTGEIKRHFRDHGWVVRPPRRIQELQVSMHRIEPELVQSLGRPVQPEDLAEALDADVADVVEALSVEGHFSPVSLDTPQGEGNATIADFIVGDDEDVFQHVDQMQSLLPAIADLTERERQILLMRFVFRYTQDRIGAEIGVSQMQVSRLLRGVLQKLRRQLDPDDDGLRA